VKEKVSSEQQSCSYRAHKQRPQQNVHESMGIHFCPHAMVDAKVTLSRLLENLQTRTSENLQKTCKELPKIFQTEARSETRIRTLPERQARCYGGFRLPKNGHRLSLDLEAIGKFSGGLSETTLQVFLQVFCKFFRLSRTADLGSAGPEVPERT